jgi:hypothetical protein
MSFEDVDQIFSQVFGRLQKLLGTYTIHFFLSSPQPWFAYWMIDKQEYEIDNGIVICKYKGQIIFTLDKDLSDFFVMMYFENGPLHAVKCMMDPFLIPPNVVPSLSYYLKDNEDKKEEEVNGQLKLLCNALEVIDQPEVHALIIGSGGAEFSRSGSSYLHLAQHLKGTMTLYDPYEVTQKVQVKDLSMYYQSQMFTYAGVPNESVTHVIDDSYDMVESQSEPDDPHLLYGVTDITYPYCGSFVVIKRFDTLYMMQCKSHADMRDRKPIGGGRCYSYDKKVVVYGSSNNFGPYNEMTMKRLFPQYEVETPTTFCVEKKMEKLKYLYPNARISTKYLQRQKPTEGCKVVDQYFYEGTEMREYCRCDPIPFTHGHCRICNLKAVASQRLKIDIAHMHTLFALVGGFSCVSRPMIGKQHMIGEIMVMAKTWSRRERVVSIICSKYHCSEELVSTAIEVLIRSGKLCAVTYATNVRLALPASLLDKEVSNSWQYRDEELWNRLALEYGIGKMMGYVQETLCDSDRIMYIGEEYCSEAYIAILVRPQVYVCAQYENTHDLVRHYGMEVFRHRSHLNKRLEKALPILEEVGD